MEDARVDRFELTLFLRWLVYSEGALPAARRLGIAKGTVASLVAGLPTNQSSWTAVELAYVRLPEGERQRLRAWSETHQRRVPYVNGSGRTL